MVDVTGIVMSVFDAIGTRVAHLSGSEAIIFEIAMILIISAILAFIAKIFRQPLIPAYVIAGLLIGPPLVEILSKFGIGNGFLGIVSNIDLVIALSEIGIAFLLFTAGLEISFGKIKEAGLKKIVFVGFFQVAIVFGLSVLVRDLVGLTMMQAIYMGIILAFGSTMVVIKLLADKGELVTMHGRLVLGILLLQDLVAIIAIAVFMSGGFALMPIAMTGLKLLIILAIAILMQKFILNKLFKFAASSTELLLISALGVLFFFIVLAYFSELSIAIGAFIAGVSLANSPFKVELESRIAPLRDFFAILFFVSLGMQVVFSGITNHWILFWVLIGAAFFVKPLITAILLRIVGYRPRTSFLTALSLAQLSEFSLIIGMLGLSLGILTNEILSTVILATIITMSLTTYFIKYKNGFYRIFRKPFNLLKFLPMRESVEYGELPGKKILMIGSHRMGAVLLKDLLKRKKKDLLVIDYNPEIIRALVDKGVSCIYGDLGSPEVLDHVDMSKMETIISTIPDYDDNLHLLRKMKDINPKLKVILTAARISEAEAMYAAGADYVILPKVIAGQELNHILKNHKRTLSKEKRKHLKTLEEIHRILY